MKKCEHVCNPTSMSFVSCKGGHTVPSQRTCLKCGKSYCVECAGLTLKEALRQAGEYLDAQKATQPIHG